MAEPIDLPWMNKTWGAPAGLEDSVKPLRVLETRGDHGGPTQSLSAWLLNPAELACVLATSLVGVNVWGQQQPLCVVAFQPEAPPESHGFVLKIGPRFWEIEELPALGEYYATFAEALQAQLRHFANGAIVSAIREARPDDRLAHERWEARSRGELPAHEDPAVLAAIREERLRLTIARCYGAATALWHVSGVEQHAEGHPGIPGPASPAVYDQEAYNPDRAKLAGAIHTLQLIEERLWPDPAEKIMDEAAGTALRRLEEAETEAAVIECLFHSCVGAAEIICGPDAMIPGSKGEPSLAGAMFAVHAISDHMMRREQIKQGVCCRCGADTTCRDMGVGLYCPPCLEAAQELGPIGPQAGCSGVCGCPAGPDGPPGVDELASLRKPFTMAAEFTTEPEVGVVEPPGAGQSSEEGAEGTCGPQGSPD